MFAALGLANHLRPFGRDLDARVILRPLRLVWRRFYGAVAFNQNIGRWDTARVVDMASLYVAACP